MDIDDDDLLGIGSAKVSTPRLSDDNPEPFEEFAQEYFRTGNAYRAYGRTYGFKNGNPATNRKNAMSVKNSKRVQARLQELREELAASTIIDKAQIVNELAKIAMFDPRGMFKVDGTPLDMHELDDNTAAAIGGFEIEPYTVKIEDPDDLLGVEPPEYVTRYRLTKVKPLDKRAALVDIGKHLGMFTDKVEHTGKDGKDLIPAEVSETEVARRVAFLLTSQLQSKK
jgi:phage terminase small subunit